MVINRQTISPILKEYNIRASKDLGQNFLCDPTSAYQIVRLLELTKEDKVLEIGPGLGSLSHFIVPDNLSATLVEIDPVLYSFLKKTYECNIVNSNIFSFDVSCYNKIISNMPYNITSDLISYLLLTALKCERFVLMCQSDAYNRITALSGEDYGPLSVLIHLSGSIHKEFTVRAGSFYPIPKCISLVFTLNREHKYDPADICGAFNLAKKVFLNRRKTAFNNLTSYLGNKELATKALEGCSIDLKARAENICPDDYLKLYLFLHK